MKRQFLFTMCVVLVLAANLTGIQPVSAQTMSAGTSLATGLPLEQLLNSDGTLDLERGFQGSLDPTGWEMVTGANGEPRFAPTMSPDDKWDAQFNRPGIVGIVYAIAVSGNDIYVGGYFTTAGGVVANNIAKWDGSNWSALGNGVDGGINTIVVNGSDIYVGGWFTTVGGMSANHIAKWDGSSWSALGMGSMVVSNIAVEGHIYVGGDLPRLAM
jgi:hypothetical protein